MASWLQLPGAVRDGIQARNEYSDGKARREMYPVVKTLLENLVREVGKHSYEARFNLFLSALGVAKQTLDVAQGYSALSALKDIGDKIVGNMEAQTGLQAPSFARKVHLFIHQRTEETRGYDNHFFFVYHPDTDWHPEFFNRAQRRPLPSNFLGMSSNLDALCSWMLFIRSMLARSRSKRKCQFHVLIPAYRPLVIKDPIIFPAKLYPLTIEGHIHNSLAQVWLHIPDMPEEGLELQDVDNLATSPTFYQRWTGTFQDATTIGTWAAGSGAAMGLTVAVAGTVAAPLAIPTFLVAASTAMIGTIAAKDAVREKLEIPAPRLLGVGSNSSEELEFQPRTRQVRRRRRHRHA